jgi:hypothetical protein
VQEVSIIARLLDRAAQALLDNETLDEAQIAVLAKDWARTG